jgi:hypothetical protein
MSGRAATAALPALTRRSVVLGAGAALLSAAGVSPARGAWAPRFAGHGRVRCRGRDCVVRLLAPARASDARLHTARGVPGVRVRRGRALRSGRAGDGAIPLARGCPRGLRPAPGGGTRPGLRLADGRDAALATSLRWLFPSSQSAAIDALEAQVEAGRRGALPPGVLERSKRRGAEVQPFWGRNRCCARGRRRLSARPAPRVLGGSRIALPRRGARGVRDGQHADV